MAVLLIGMEQGYTAEFLHPVFFEQIVVVVLEVHLCDQELLCAEDQFKVLAAVNQRRIDEVYGFHDE